MESNSADRLNGKRASTTARAAYAMRRGEKARLEKPRIVRKKGFLGFKKGFKGFFRVLYEDRTRQYDQKAQEKHPIHGTPYLIKDASPVSEGQEYHVKNEGEIDEPRKSQLKF